MRDDHGKHSAHLGHCVLPTERRHSKIFGAKMPKCYTWVAWDIPISQGHFLSFGCCSSQLFPLKTAAPHLKLTVFTQERHHLLVLLVLRLALRHNDGHVPAAARGSAWPRSAPAVGRRQPDLDGHLAWQDSGSLKHITGQLNMFLDSK